MNSLPSAADVVVIGAGPAGASAAAAAATHGLEVLVLERKDTIGAPVQCAEYVPAGFIGGLDCKTPSICAQKISAMQTFIEYRLERQTAAPGFIINRDAFDLMLADRARKSGAALCTSTRVLGLKNEATLQATKRKSGVVEIERVCG